MHMIKYWIELITDYILCGELVMERFEKLRQEFAFLRYKYGTSENWLKPGVKNRRYGPDFSRVPYPEGHYLKKLKARRKLT